MPETIRVQKALADAGVASRRAADALVVAGRVTVNGEPAVTGQRVDPAVDALAVDGRPVVPAGKRTYLVMHKPAGVTSTVSYRHAEQTVLDLVPGQLVRAGSQVVAYFRGGPDGNTLQSTAVTAVGKWGHAPAAATSHGTLGAAEEFTLRAGPDGKPRIVRRGAPRR